MNILVTSLKTDAKFNYAIVSIGRSEVEVNRTFQGARVIRSSARRTCLQVTRYSGRLNVPAPPCALRDDAPFRTGAGGNGEVASRNGENDVTIPQTSRRA